MTIANEEAAMLCRLAGQDALAFAALIGNPHIELRIACFHGQQAVEKYLKAVLVVRGVAFLPTHNLLKLAELLTAAGIALPVSTDALKRLNPQRGRLSLRRLGYPHTRPRRSQRTRQDGGGLGLGGACRLAPAS